MLFSLGQVDDVVVLVAPVKIELADLQLERKIDLVLFLGFEIRFEGLVQQAFPKVFLAQLEEFPGLGQQGGLQRLVDRVQPRSNLREMVDHCVHPIHHQGESPLKLSAQFLESGVEGFFDAVKLLGLLAQLVELLAGYPERLILKPTTLPLGGLSRLNRVLDVQEIVVPFVLAVVIRAKDSHRRPCCEDSAFAFKRIP